MTTWKVGLRSHRERKPCMNVCLCPSGSPNLTMSENYALRRHPFFPVFRDWSASFGGSYGHLKVLEIWHAFSLFEVFFHTNVDKKNESVVEDWCQWTSKSNIMVFFRIFVFSVWDWLAKREQYNTAYCIKYFDTFPPLGSLFYCEDEVRGRWRGRFLLLMNQAHVF